MKRSAGSFVFALASAVTLTGSAAGTPSSSPPPALATEEFMVPSGDPGIDLYVRNRHPVGVTHFTADRILLFVHGATYPAETTFDLALGGLSMMQFIAQGGYDVYLVDVRGYGRSTRPAAMDQPPDQNPPIARTETAVKDVGAAVDFILKRRGVSKLSLMGWSWGTAIMGWYAARNNEKVHRLVLYAPRWLASSPSLVDSGGALGAYRSISIPSARERWLKGVPEGKKAELIPPGWFDAWAAATLASDPVGAKANPPALRAPNGVIQDNREYWTAGKPLYDPASIRVPVFLVHAEWDQDLPSPMLYAYFATLTSAPYRRCVEIGEGTHTVFLEKNRMQLFREVLAFLDESFTPGD
jgi:pimeloyl-ACP methyl ester carboxylesterase